MLLEKRRSFRAILSLLFLDNLGLAVIYPIFTSLVLSHDSTLLPINFSLTLRLFLLAILIAAFPTAQFLSNPFMENLSHMASRKRALFLTTLAGTAGFLLTGWSLKGMSYIFLLISRLLSGFFAGNTFLCLNAVSDLTKKDAHRSKYFGQVTTVIGVAFVIAIVIGGILSNSTLDGFFNPSLPFWTLALLSLMNGWIIHRYYKEIPGESRTQNQTFLTKIQELKSLFKTTHLGYLYTLFFFLMLGWVISLQFLSTFLIEHFSGTKLSITLTFLGMGLAWCIGKTLIHPLLSQKLKTHTLLFSSLILACVFLFIASEVWTFILFVHALILVALFASLAWTNCLVYISQTAPSRAQGKLLGYNQLIATVSMAFSPLFGGMVGTFDIRVIYLCASSSILIAVFIFVIYKTKNSL